MSSGPHRAAIGMAIDALVLGAREIRPAGVAPAALVES